MAEKEELQYDEEESIKFIQNNLPAELKGKFNDDDILYLLDVAEEFYESKGDIDSLDENDEEELIKYVIKNAKEDGVGSFKTEDVLAILDGDLEYCKSIELFD
ncbi:MAG: hypothetical protein LBJ58_04085 [Tannerellaceae bacterium]|jgi:hypothetical protein|nr:hypothetical protein [Tannerellaceae bacterium]